MPKDAALDQPGSNDEDLCRFYRIIQTAHCREADKPPLAIRILRPDRLGLLIWYFSFQGLKKGSTGSEESPIQGYNHGIRKAYQHYPEEMQQCGFVSGPMPDPADLDGLDKWSDSARIRLDEWLSDARSRPEIYTIIEAIGRYYWEDPRPTIKALRKAIAKKRGESVQNVEKQEITGAICANQRLDFFKVTKDGKLQLRMGNIRNRFRNVKDQVREDLLCPEAQDTLPAPKDRAQELLEDREQADKALRRLSKNEQGMIRLSFKLELTPEEWGNDAAHACRLAEAGFKITPQWLGKMKNSIRNRLSG